MTPVGYTGTGYSGTPLAKKLGVKANTTVALVNAPAGWSVDVPDGVTVKRAKSSLADVTVAFFNQRSKLASSIERLGALIHPDRSLWIAWPRKAAGHVSDMDENGIRDLALPMGLVDVKVAAIDEDWSGLKLVWRKENR